MAATFLRMRLPQDDSMVAWHSRSVGPLLYPGRGEVGGAMVRAVVVALRVSQTSGSTSPPVVC